MPDEKEKTVEQSEELAEILRLARKRFDASAQAESRYREDAIIDREFVDGKQWPDFVAKKRKNRIKAVVNKTRIMRNSVVGTAMDVSLKPKVEPKKGGSVEGAKILDSIITDILEKSKIDRVNMSVVKDSATSGRGFFHITPEFDATGFHQHLLVKHVANPLTVFQDATAIEFLYDDARWGGITSIMSEEDFEFEYPGAKQTSFEYNAKGNREQSFNWFDEEGIVVAHYYYLKPQIVRRAQMESGEIFELSDEVTEEVITSTINPATIQIDPQTGATVGGTPFVIAEIREIKEHTVMWTKISGSEVLEGPIDLKISKVPIIPAIGYDENISGQRISRGVVYDMRDPQRMYNYHYSSEAEILANQTKAPFLLFDDMLDIHTKAQWDNLSTSNPSYLLVKRTAGNVLPQRVQPPMSSTGNINYMVRADNDMKDVTGIFSSAIGKQDNARSKVAIDARKVASNTNTRVIIFNWVDARLEVGRRLIEWIPIIYDTEMVIMINGEGKQKIPVTINQTTIGEDGEEVILNDLREGTYDYVIQAGRAGLTSRQEKLMSIQEFTQNLPPELKIMFADIVAELSGMDEDIVDRMKGIIQGISQQQQEQPTPPEIK